MNAWLLTWEGTHGPAVEPDQKILAILSARRRSSTVEDIVDTLYCRCVNSANDMMLQANKRKQRLAQYRHLGSISNRFFYGHDPCIFARLVTDLTISLDEAQHKERIRWTEPTILGNSDSGSEPKEIYSSRKCEVIRSMRPLACDIHDTKT